MLSTDHDYEQFDRTSYDLYDVLAKHKLFGKKAPKKRADLLKTLFSFIECDSAIVRFHVARLSLAVSALQWTVELTALLSNVHSSFEWVACKIYEGSSWSLLISVGTKITIITSPIPTFSVSWFLWPVIDSSIESHLDLLFESISRIDTSSNLESIGYFCTTLKNLTVNNDLIRLISEKKPFQLLKRILKELLQVVNSLTLTNARERRYFPLAERSSRTTRSSNWLSDIGKYVSMEEGRSDDTFLLRSSSPGPWGI